MGTGLALQLSVLQNLHCSGVVLVDEWASFYLLCEQLYLVAVPLHHSIRPIYRNAERTRQRVPQMFVPPAELAVEVVACVGFTTLVDTPRPVRLHLSVDHLGHALVGRCPVMVTA